MRISLWRSSLAIVLALGMAIFISFGAASAPGGISFKKVKKVTTPPVAMLGEQNQPTTAGSSQPSVSAMQYASWNSSAASQGTDRWQQLCHSSGVFNDSAVVGGTSWKTITGSTFYIGEEAGSSNANISNISTAWSDHAVTDFASMPDRWGPRDPDAWDGPWYGRDGWCPQGDNVVLKQNPFYVALPTPDHDSNGAITAAEKWVVSASQSLPELKAYKDGKFGDASPFKNLWVAVEANGKVALAQLEDVGPSDAQGQIAADYGWVWDPAVTKPKNTFGVKAGIDLSPALSDYLGVRGSGTVRWRFIPAEEVKKQQTGPWTVLVTTSGPNWN